MQFTSGAPEGENMKDYRKVLAIIAFTLVLVTLVVAIISDIAIFAETIMTFVFGTLFSVFAFFFLVIAMLASCILVFGIYLLKEHGFWPLDLTIKLYKEILDSIHLTEQQVITFRGFRIAFLIICVITFIMAIVALHKDELISPKVPLKGLSIVALILSILGIITAIGSIAITSAILG